MRHIDLFSGIGGFALAAKWAGFRTSVFCERDAYCQRVLRKHWPDVPIVGDIHEFDGTEHLGATLLTGGFPCQPFSVAGKRRGAGDDRHLWPEMRRVIATARPVWVVGENVPGIVKMELDGVLADLENLGYACWTAIIPACAVDAPHRRNRVWIVAHAESETRQRRAPGESGFPSQRRETLAHAGSQRLAQRKEQPAREEQQAVERSGNAMAHAARELPHRAGAEGSRRAEFANCCQWEPEPGVGRVVDGLPHRVDRLRGLGNAIVPQVAFEILRGIAEIEGGTHGLD